MKLGIDLDDVIVDFFPSFFTFYNKKYEKNFNIEKMDSYYIWEIGIGKNREEAIKLIDEFYDSLEFDLMPLSPGAGEAIKKLSNLGFDIFIITSRPLRFKNKTEKFLKKYFSDVPFEIKYSTGLEEQRETKAEICKKLGINVIIEDAPNYAKICALNGIKTLLLDRPWNQNLEHENIKRVYNWGEILEKINKLNMINKKI